MRYLRATIVLIFSAGCVHGVLARQLPDIFKDDKKPAEEARPAANPSPNPFRPEAPTLDRRLKDLKDQSATSRPQFYSDLRSAREAASSYRKQVEEMRNLYYLPDPPREHQAAQLVDGFERRWGDLARSISDGQIPQTPIPVGRWAHYAQGLDPLYCDSLTRRVPGEGMRLVGMAWSCLADLFFRDLSKTEIKVSALMAAEREKVTQELDAAMKLVDLKLAGALDEESRQFVNRVAELLHAVDLKLINLRIRELENRMRDRRLPAFRSFLEMSRVVRRPAEGSAANLALGTSARLRLLAGPLPLEFVVRGLPRQSQLVRELHQIHNRIALIEQRGLGSAETREQRDVAERDRARVLGQMSEEAR